MAVNLSNRGDEGDALFTHLDVPLDVEPQHGHGRADLICRAETMDDNEQQAQD